ncbi:methionine synthase [Ornithinimicrobium pratense]|uniref:Methionine synthase n=1 Tax=Ornithinimicrobium pratense TaxID=2593973 RepID=A0A5J6V8E3_9MICO|nr:methionine synthase [Ornithinimicrobium pratense]
MTGVVATGVGSWPGQDVREALRVLRGELASGQAPDGVVALPYLAELPARGPGADMIGRTAQLLVDLPVDLQPQGWRLVDRPGRDVERALSLWRQDLDELAETFDGYAGPLKVQVVGPWTMAAALWKPLGDKVLSDSGATRDLTESLAEGVAAHVADVRRLIPGAQVVLQVDEPSLSAVFAGRIRSESGYRTLRTPEREEAQTALGRVLDQPAAADRGAHCCADDPPVDVLVGAGARFLALDLARLDGRRWEQVAVAHEAGVRLWAGMDLDAAEAAEPLRRVWSELGLPVRDLGEVGVIPPCGLAGVTPDGARTATRRAVELAARLAETARS